MRFDVPQAYSTLLLIGKERRFRVVRWLHVGSSLLLHPSEPTLINTCASILQIRPTSFEDSLWDAFSMTYKGR